VHGHYVIFLSCFVSPSHTLSLSCFHFTHTHIVSFEVACTSLTFFCLLFSLCPSLSLSLSLLSPLSSISSLITSLFYLFSYHLSLLSLLLSPLSSISSLISLVFSLVAHHKPSPQCVRPNHRDGGRNGDGPWVRGRNLGSWFRWGIGPCIAAFLLCTSARYRRVTLRVFVFFFLFFLRVLRLLSIYLFFSRTHSLSPSLSYFLSFFLSPSLKA
jgi:hypothetical protein